MFEELQNIDLFPPSIFDIIGNTVISLICGLIISIVYRYTYRGPSYSVTFVNSLVMLTMITSVVILVIGNNLARAFGLVGAMSIIRFRTAVRDVQDIIFIFFALAMGMAAGVGLTVIAIVGTLFISFVMIMLVYTNFGAPKKREYLLQVSYPSTPENEGEVGKVLKRYCKNLKLINLKNIGYNEDIEAYYHIMLKNPSKSKEFVNELNALQFLNNFNLYFDEDDVNPPSM